MFEKELQAYLKAALPALPCAEARTRFAAFVRSVVQDACGGESQPDFATVASLLGEKPEQAARDFVESQSSETLGRWEAAARRHEVCLRLIVALTIGLLTVIVAFFFLTKGVLVVNTKTTHMYLGDSSYTQEELDMLAEQSLKQIMKEHENNEN